MSNCKIKINSKEDKKEHSFTHKDQRSFTHKLEWFREFMAELLGTFFLISIGDGTIASFLLNKNNKQGVDPFTVSLAFGVGALVGVCFAEPISGAHLNPAVTVALAASGKFPMRKIPVYLLAQYLGSFCAAFVIFTVYYEAINAYDMGVRVAYGEGNMTAAAMATGSIFATYPASHVTIVGSLWDQIVATFILMFSVCVVTDKAGFNLPKSLQPLYLALVITAICVAFALNCGAILNPARDLAPRIFSALAGYGTQPFKPLGSFYWLTAGLIGPHLGAVLGAWIYYGLQMTQKGGARRPEPISTNDDYNDDYTPARTASPERRDSTTRSLMEGAHRLRLYANHDADRKLNDKTVVVVSRGDSDEASEVPAIGPNANDKQKNWYEITDKSIIIVSSPTKLTANNSNSSTHSLNET